MSNALAIGKPGTVIATLAQDYAFGRDFVTAFKTALAPTGAKLVFEEYAPPLTTDFTAPIQRIFDALAKEQGRKIIFVNWAGGGNPLAALKAMGPERLGIEISTGANILPALVAYKDFPGLEGAAYYYYEIPKNPVNDALVAENKKRFNGAPPDFFTCGGFIAAQAVVLALKKTGGSTDTEKLIAAMEGMAFELAEGYRAVPQGGPSAAAADVRLQDQGRSERGMGDPGTHPRNHHGRDENPHRQQAPIGHGEDMGRRRSRLVSRVVE